MAAAADIEHGGAIEEAVDRWPWRAIGDKQMPAVC